MHILNVDFQLVTENIASNLDEKTRILENVAPSWNFVVIFSVILGLVLVKQFAAGRMGLVLSMLYQNPDTEKVTRGWNPLTSLTGFSVAVSYIVLLALFVQKSVLILNGNVRLYGGVDFFLEACLFASAFVLVRYLFINIIGWMFCTQSASQHHAIIHIAMMALMNFVLLPLVLVLTFYQSKFWLFLGISIMIVFNVYRIVKSFIDFQFIIKNATLKIFLYLCTLEIIPISVAFTMAFRLVATNSVL